jgi:acetoacetyl-CoA synthetase
MPLHFLNDPDDARYRNTYFSTYPGMWRHGDWAEFTEHGGLIIHGRSDSTLNARGVRIGTAEIYRQLTDVEEVRECVVVAQDWEGDSRVLMFVQLSAGMTYDNKLEQRIRNVLRDGLSPRHVPSKIIPVQAIPATFTGKVSEAAVRDAIHGRSPANLGALVNPESLACFDPSALPALHTA